MEFIRKKNLLTVVVQGDFDLSVCPRLKNGIDRELGDNVVNRIIFDLEDCGFIDSSGLGLILTCYKRTASQGGGVAVKNLRPELLRLFEMAGMARIIAITLQGEVRHV